MSWDNACQRVMLHDPAFHARPRCPSGAATCALCGMACHTRSPRRTAASTSATVLAFGQRSPMWAGQSKNSDSNQLCTRVGREGNGCSGQGLQQNAAR